MLINNSYKKYFDQEQALMIQNDLKDQKINYKLNYFEKSLNSSLKKTIIKALKIHSLTHLRLSITTKITPDANNSNDTYCAEDHSTSNNMMSLSENPQALVNRFPIAQLVIGIWMECVLAYIHDDWITAPNKFRSFQHGLLQGKKYV